MRWDSLFDDLESQLEHELHAEELDRRAEEQRLRVGRLTLRDRLQALSARNARRGAVTLELATGESITVLPQTFGRDWLSADLVGPDGASGACIVPLDAIAGVVLPKHTLARSLDVPAREEDAPRLTDRIGLPFALRDLCRRRVYVDVHTRSVVSSAHGGTIDRVAGDHVDLAVHDRNAPRRERNVSQVRLVPLREIVLILL